MILNGNRNELQIMYELLLLSKNKPINKTRLMYQTNLSYSHFVRYLMFLLEHDFLGEKEGNPVGKNYFITEKGKQFLTEFKNVLEIMP
jgi:predicted transcriptional regulator